MPRALFLILAVAGSLAVVWGTATLQGIFVEEREAAQAAIEVRRRGLEQYALVALEKKLRAALADARPRIDAALADPLAPEDGLLLVQGGRQVLPRQLTHLPGTETPASDWYRQLEQGRWTGDGPLGERLTLLARLQDALDKGDDDAITQSVRAVLDHQTRFLLPVARDLPYRVRFLEVFVAGASPDPSLLQALLRDGLRGSQGRRLTGLQPFLLSKADRFTRADFDFLRAKISELSRRTRVVHDDFEAAAAREGAAVSLPKQLKQAALVAHGEWFAAPLETDGLFGISVELEALLRDIAADMKRGGLLASSDQLRSRRPDRETLPVADLRVAVASAALSAEAREIDGRYRLKTATGVALGLSILGIAALLGVLYRRERRFLEAKASFVATVSHELRTPIASLRLMGETLERRLEGVETARDFPSRIVGETERLSFLVENILSYNRLERARVETNLQNVSLAEIIDAVQADAEAFTKKPVRVRIEAGGGIELRADPELLKLVFSNLLNNSCKYHQREQVEVVVRATRHADRTTVQFCDNGIGIPSHDWHAVFTEFVRSRSQPGSSGFGLGLALCRRIMDLHGGTLRVQSSSEAGTTFELQFPQPSNDP